MIPSIPDQLAVMALPGAILFPGSMFPLYIFEQKYREMLSHALDQDRMFAIGMLRDDTSDGSVYPIGGAGLVRACVQNSDGTSHLVLQGVQRVRFAEWLQVEPYRIAEVEVLESTNQQTGETAKLAAMIRSLCNDLSAQGFALPSEFQEYLDQINDPEALGDLISSTLVPDPILRQELLQELDVPVRLKGLMLSLQKQIKSE
jgi:ATP-dependent Lon protease